MPITTTHPKLLAPLYDALRQALEEMSRSGVRDPIKNVYFDDVSSFDNRNIFDFLGDFSFDSGGVNTINIEYASTLYSIMVLDVDMGIFRVVDALLHDLTYRKVDIQSDQISKRIYDYLQLRDERASMEERSMFYKQVFNVGEGKMMAGMTTNRDFNSLWESLMNEAVRYIRKFERVDHPMNVSKSGIHQSILALQRNLSRSMSGIVKLYVPQMYAHLEDAFAILDSPEVIAQKGHGTHRDVFNAIEQISVEHFNYFPNVASLRTIAFTAREIILDIARFTTISFSDADFQRFIENCEAFIVAQSQLPADNKMYLNGKSRRPKKDLMKEFDDFEELEPVEDEWGF